MGTGKISRQSVISVKSLICSSIVYLRESGQINKSGVGIQVMHYVMTWQILYLCLLLGNSVFEHAFVSSAGLKMLLSVSL